MSDLMLDVGQANEIKLAARRAGANNADLKRLSEGDMFSRILPILRGMGEVQIVKHMIDLDALPFVPDGWKVEGHEQSGQLEWSFDKVELHLDEDQKDGKWIEGNKLRNRLAKLPVMNANVLDYLLAHPHLIPEEWKGKFVFFWGTIYRHSDGVLCVRYLRRDGGKWFWRTFWLGGAWGDDRPALVLAK